MEDIASASAAECVREAAYEAEAVRLKAATHAGISDARRDAAPSVPVASQAQAAQTVNKVSGRRDVLTVAIEAAQSEAQAAGLSRYDVSAVWARLEAAANRVPQRPPLLSSNSGGVHYRDGKDRVFTRKSLAERLRRAGKAPR